MAESIDDSHISNPWWKKSPWPMKSPSTFVAEKYFKGHYTDVTLGEGIVPEEHDKFIDPRLENYPVPKVAKTVDLRNDPT
jgi:hypothetical protein